MKKNNSIILCTGLLAVAATGTAAQTSPLNPNVVLFVVDDWGWNDIGIYGSKYYRTPCMDSLARHGVRFTNAYAACTVSSPSRAALMTGKYPARLHLTDWISGWNYPWARLCVPDWKKYLPLEETTVAEYLSDAGYATWHVGKWHLGDDEKYWPENQGFDVNIGGNYKGSPNLNPKLGYGGYFSPYGLPRLTDGPKGEYLTDRLTDEAVSLIEKSRRDKPFFLNFCHYAVHTPLGAKPELERKYEALADSSYFQNNATYAAMIESVDHSLAAVIAALKAKGILDNTLIIVTSDNGALHKISKNLPLRAGKGSEYEGGVRVPLIISWPAVIAGGKVCDAPAISVDMLPTIISACGVRNDDNFDGVNLLPACCGTHMSERPLFWHYPHYHPGGAHPYSAIRLGDWKLIRKYETGAEELYNLKDDIGEKHDLAETHPQKREELGNLLNKWLKETHAQMPTPNPAWDVTRENKTGSYKGK